jgi:aryl-alcohol dehydrogenase-like predicted oxidoreductase
MARARETSPAALAIAWALAKQSHLVAVAGARTLAQLDAALAAVSLKLTAAEIEELERAVPASAVAGDRYQSQQLAHLDSER